MEAVVKSIQRVCAGGLDSVSLRREIAARLSREVAFDGHAFSTCDPDTGLLTHTLASGIPDGLAQAYVDRLYPEVCVFLESAMVRRGVPVFSMLDSSARVREAFREHGLDFQLHTSFAMNGRLWGDMCLMRETSGDRTLERLQALLARVAPIIARGLRAASLVDQGLGAAPPLPGEIHPGVIVLDAASHPAVRTPPAATWLADLADEGLQTPGDLPMSVLSAVSRLRRARTEVAAETRVRARGRSGRWYILHATLAEPDAAGESRTVVVVRPAAKRETAAILTRLYGLSEREREIIAAVARGGSTKEIAASLGVSPHTVAEHIERACRKIGVRGRKALVAKMFVDGYLPSHGVGKLHA